MYLVGIIATLLMLLGILPAASGQTGSGDDRILKLPYAAERRFTSVEKLADGSTRRSESGGSEARDSQGRAYSAGERHWTYLDHGKAVLKSEMLYRIYDPVSSTETKWDSTSREAKVIHWPKKASGAAFNSFSAFLTAPTGTIVKKLGEKRIEGTLAVGTRSSYTIAGTKGSSGQPLNVVHESWYCPELKLVVLETNDDPRSGTTRNELVRIVRGEPNVEKYGPPADYLLHHVRVPIN